MAARLCRRVIVGILFALATACAGAQTPNETVLVKRPAELREAPGESARSLIALPLQTPLTRMPARQGAWIQVRTATGTTGWVHMFDVSTSSAAVAGSGTATGALRGISNFFNRGSAQGASTTATSTIGIRGLGAEDIANAAPNLTALTQVESMRQDAAQARRFAADLHLTARTVEPLPVPATTVTNESENRFKLP